MRILIAAVLFVAFVFGFLPASWCAALLFTLLVLTPRPRKNSPLRRPGYVPLSLSAYGYGNQATEQTPRQPAISTASSVRRDIREAFTAGPGGLADRLRTGSPTASTSGTESSRGSHMTAAGETVLFGDDALDAWHSGEANVLTWSPTDGHAAIPTESPWRSPVHPHPDNAA